MKSQLRTNLREAYDKAACGRDGLAIQAWKKIERSAFLSLLIREQKAMLLEIGAGTGRDSLFFQEQGLEVYCTDLSPEMIKLCEQKGLSAKMMDFSNLQFPDSSFDAIYALNCLLHLPKRELPTVLAAINSILKTNGLLYMGVYGGYDYEGIWAGDSYEPRRFFSFYSDDHLKKVVSDIFNVYSFKQVEIGETNSDLHFQSVILRKRRDKM